MRFLIILFLSVLGMVLPFAHALDFSHPKPITICPKKNKHEEKRELLAKPDDRNPYGPESKILRIPKRGKCDQ